MISEKQGNSHLIWMYLWERFTMFWFSSFVVMIWNIFSDSIYQTFKSFLFIYSLLIELILYALSEIFLRETCACCQWKCVIFILFFGFYKMLTITFVLWENSWPKNGWCLFVGGVRKMITIIIRNHWNNQWQANGENLNCEIAKRIMKGKKKHIIKCGVKIQVYKVELSFVVSLFCVDCEDKLENKKKCCWYFGFLLLNCMF